MPTVSTIVPAYNQGHYLEEAIRSVLTQSYGDFEIVVVDDGSTDDTAHVAKSFAHDSRLRYIRQENRGLSAARNTGIRHATGKFLTYLDSDDLFLPEKLHFLLSVVEARPELGFVAGQAILIDETGQSRGEVFDRGLPQNTAELLLGNPLHVGSVLVRREWQERVGFFDESLRSYEDWDLWLRLARAGCPMAWVPHPVSLYRFHRKQMTRISKQMTTATFAVLDKTYRDPQLPEHWQSLRTKAYSRAYLRAAAQAYSAEVLDEAKVCMAKAVHLDPQLCADQGENLAGLIAGWANHAKTQDPLIFLRRIYDHLPVELENLRRRRELDLARQALHLAFAAHQRRDYRASVSTLWYLFVHWPKRLLNRGVLSILADSCLSWFMGVCRVGAKPFLRKDCLS